jgi:hypothetical protein
MPFEPGNQLATRNRSSQTKIWADALRIAITRAHASGGTKLQALADKTVDEGLAGNMAAIKEIGDRLDGRPPQTLQHEGGDPDRPIYSYTGVPRFGDPPEPTDP